MIEALRTPVARFADLPDFPFRSALSKIRFESLFEGQAAQTMHIGPFSEEGPAIERVHDFINEKGLKRFGKHHESYLSDIRRAAPEKWKTIIRQPMREGQ